MYVSLSTLLTGLSVLIAGSVAYYRYIWGAKPHVSISRQSSVEDTEWRDAVSDDTPVWSRRIMVRASNAGWRDGVICGISLERVVVDGDVVIEDPADSVHKIVLEKFGKDGNTTRINLRHRTNYEGQIISGRDDVLMGILPFIKRDSKVGRAMRSGDRGVFTFVIDVEGNAGQVESKSVDVSTSLEDSAGGDLGE